LPRKINTMQGHAVVTQLYHPIRARICSTKVRNPLENLQITISVHTVPTQKLQRVDGLKICEGVIAQARLRSKAERIGMGTPESMSSPSKSQACLTQLKYRRFFDVAAEV
jgi:hypothetical protein